MGQVIVDTPYGCLRGSIVEIAPLAEGAADATAVGAGRRSDVVARFLGIPFAAPPVGTRRLRSPARPEPWTGVRDALAIGSPSLQVLSGNQTWLYEPLPPADEDCLYLNVWTPDVGGRLPVFVWMHGGAQRNGHGGAGAFDGARLAHRGRVVVITVSYRLGGLGGLAHPDLTDPTTGLCANWGLQDKIAALRWVRECAGPFGGDAGNVTVAGQSSGATNVALIAQDQALGGLFHRVVLQSPPLLQPPMFAELDEAAEYTELLAERVNVDVGGLHSVDGRVLFEAERDLIRSADVIARMGRPRTAPVRDGVLVREWPYGAQPHPLPLLIGWTRDEARFWYDLRDAGGAVISPQTVPQTEEALVDEVKTLIRLYCPFIDAPAAEEAIATYREHLLEAAAAIAAGGAGSAEMCDVLCNEMHTDLVFRAPAVHHAGRHAAAGAPTYVYEFAQPLRPPGRGSPHASDVPFVFGTIDHPHLADKVGHGTDVEEVSRMMMDLWVSFVHGGRPEAAAVECWEPWRIDQPAVLVLGRRGGGDGQEPAGAARWPTRSGAPPRADQLSCWPAFTP